MKRRPKALAKRQQSICRHRERRRLWADVPGGADPSCVSAAVIYTDPFPSPITAAWLEPDSHDESNSTAGQF